MKTLKLIWKNFNIARVWVLEFLWKCMVASMLAWAGFIIWMVATGQWDMWDI